MQTLTSTSSDQSNDANTTGGSGAADLGTDSAVQTTTTTFGDTETDSSSSGGSDDTTLSEQGYFAGNSFVYGSVVYQDSGAQSSSYAAAGSDSYTSTSVSTYTTTATGSNTGNYNYSSSSALGSFVTTGQSTLTQSGNDDWSQSVGSSDSSTLYESGSFDSVGYSFESVAYSDTSGASWSAQESDSSADSGTDSTLSTGTTSQGGSSSYGGLVAGGLGTSSILQDATDQYADSNTDSNSQSGSETTSLDEQGTFGNFSFALSSVVYQEDGSQSGSDEQSSTSSFSGVMTTTTTTTSNQATGDAFGSGACNALGTMVQTSQNNFTQNGSDAGSSTSEDNDDYSLNEAGTFGQLSYAFSSVVYTENDSSSSSSEDSQSGSDSGSDSTLTTGTYTGSGWAAGGAQSVTSIGTSSGVSASSDSYTDSYSGTQQPGQHARREPVRARQLCQRQLRLQLMAVSEQWYSGLQQFPGDHEQLRRQRHGRLHAERHREFGQQLRHHSLHRAGLDLRQQQRQLLFHRQQRRQPEQRGQQPFQPVRGRGIQRRQLQPVQRGLHQCRQLLVDPDRVQRFRRQRHQQLGQQRLAEPERHRGLRRQLHLWQRHLLCAVVAGNLRQPEQHQPEPVRQRHR